MVPEPDRPLVGNPNVDEAASSTRVLAPDGEGRPTTALTTLSNVPSPFGPHPLAAGTENELSPWTVPLTMSDARMPFGLGVPSGSNCSTSSIAFDRSVFAGCKTIGFASEPMKQLGPRSTPGVWLTRWILTGSVRIGMPSEIPASKSKSVGVPADTTVARTVAGPAVTVAGSAMSDPPGAPMNVKVKAVVSTTSPPCRLLFPVIVGGKVPILMLPCVEFEATQKLTVLTPSVASMAGSSTAQRLNGVQPPGPAWNVWSAPVVVPAEFVATARKW